ncbi:MAG: ATP synthase F1 subunit epsilon [Phycisphaerae bacterium]
MASATLNCAIITPERQVFDGPVTAAVFAAHDGLIGVLHNRAPMLCELGIGELRLETPQGSMRFFIDGGFGQVAENQLSILTQKAVPADELVRAEAQKARTAASELKITDDASFQARQDALARADAQLKLATH